MADTLPKPKLIPKLAKTADMISISSKGHCGEDDFRHLRLKETRLPGRKRGSYQVEKSRYALDI